MQFEHFLRAVSTTSVRLGLIQSVDTTKKVLSNEGLQSSSPEVFRGFEDEKRERSRVFEKTVRFQNTFKPERLDAAYAFGDEDVQLVASRTASDDEKVSRTNLEDFIIRADCLWGRFFGLCPVKGALSRCNVPPIEVKQ